MLKRWDRIVKPGVYFDGANCRSSAISLAGSFGQQERFRIIRHGS
jgi:hypothetical protein